MKGNSNSTLILNPDQLKKAARVIRAVNHPLRQKMLHLLRDNKEVNVTDIYKKLHLEQSVASQILAILREAKVVNVRRDGKQRYYSINKEQIDHINTVAVKLID